MIALMDAESGRQNTYQWMLRGLGAFLDEEPSCRISIAEVEDGFLVRMQRALHKLEPKVLHFERETLIGQLDELVRTRPSGALKAHHQGIWSQFPNGHQDFMRALGFELDQSSARGILIDELEDGIALTYSYPEGDSWRKRIVILGMPELEEILNSAFDRRKSSTVVGQA
jgi:hypothetical protein